MKLLRVFFGILCAFSIAPLFVNAAAQVNYLNIDGDAVHFSIAEAKAVTSPSCVVSETSERFAFSLKTDAGRAMYSLLITAMAAKQDLTVDSAQDCADVAGIERTNGISIAPVVEPPSNSGGTEASCGSFYSIRSAYTHTNTGFTQAIMPEVTDDEWYTVLSLSSGAVFANLYLRNIATASDVSMRLTIDGITLPIVSMPTGTTGYKYYTKGSMGLPFVYAKNSVKIEVKSSNMSTLSSYVYIGYQLADFACN